MAQVVSREQFVDTFTVLLSVLTKPQLKKISKDPRSPWILQQITEEMLK